MPAQLPDVLARVNGEAVTKVDFDRMIKNMEVAREPADPAERRDEIFRSALDQLVTYTVLSQETRAPQGRGRPTPRSTSSIAADAVAVSERGGVQEGARGARHDAREAEGRRARSTSASTR